jgi:hypothetical protein
MLLRDRKMNGISECAMVGLVCLVHERQMTPTPDIHVKEG